MNTALEAPPLGKHGLINTEGREKGFVKAEDGQVKSELEKGHEGSNQI